MGSESEAVGPSEIRSRYVAGERDFRGLEIEDGGDATSFRGAVLEGADFSGSFILADFTSANLRGCKFVESNVKTCSFDAADLRDCDFSGAAIDAATFHGARLDGSRFANASAYGYTFQSTELPER
jgi:uncharacterized protein YjbI with pentapeptide repeats